jgi:hypothetical protein
VLKKNGIDQRIIVDARRANRHFRTPPHVDLCTSEGISRIEVEVPESVDVNSQEGEKYLRDVCCALGFLDVRDCFHRMVMPEWLSEYFCFRPVAAKYVDVSKGLIGGGPCGTDELVWPCCRCLPMGFSWALFLAQRVNEHVCQPCPVLANSQLFNDNSEPVVIQVGASGTKVCRHYVYVDNIGALGPHAAYAKKGPSGTGQEI